MYAERGRPSIDPVVFFKLWYLGYALDEGLPDHSSLTRIWQRLGIEIFERFFFPFFLLAAASPAATRAAQHLRGKELEDHQRANRRRNR